MWSLRSELDELIENKKPNNQIRDGILEKWDNMQESIKDVFESPYFIGHILESIYLYFVEI